MNLSFEISPDKRSALKQQKDKITKSIKVLGLASMVATLGLSQTATADIETIGCPVLLDANGARMGLPQQSGNAVYLQDDSLANGRLLNFRVETARGVYGQGSVYFASNDCSGQGYMFDNHSAGIITPFTDSSISPYTIYVPDIAAPPGEILAPGDFAYSSTLQYNGSNVACLTQGTPRTLGVAIYPVISTSFDSQTLFPSPFSIAAGSCEAGGDGSGGGSSAFASYQVVTGTTVNIPKRGATVSLSCPDGKQVITHGYQLTNYKKGKSNKSKKVNRHDDITQSIPSEDGTSWSWFVNAKKSSRLQFTPNLVCASVADVTSGATETTDCPECN